MCMHKERPPYLAGWSVVHGGWLSVVPARFHIPRPTLDTRRSTLAARCSTPDTRSSTWARSCFWRMQMATRHGAVPWLPRHGLLVAQSLAWTAELVACSRVRRRRALRLRAVALDNSLPTLPLTPGPFVAMASAVLCVCWPVTGRVARSLLAMAGTPLRVSHPSAPRRLAWPCAERRHTETWRDETEVQQRVESWPARLRAWCLWGSSLVSLVPLIDTDCLRTTLSTALQPANSPHNKAIGRLPTSAGTGSMAWQNPRRAVGAQPNWR